MAREIPANSVMTEAMITDWMTRYSATRDEAITQIENVEAARVELPSDLPQATYKAVVESYWGNRDKGATVAAGIPKSIVAAGTALAVAVGTFVTLAVTTLTVATANITELNVSATSTLGITDAATTTIDNLTVSATSTLTGDVVLGANAVLSGGRISSSRILATNDGSYDTPIFGWAGGEGMARGISGQVAIVGGGGYLMSLQQSGLTTYASLSPSVDVAQDLGGVSNRWSKAYIDNPIVGSLEAATGTFIGTATSTVQVGTQAKPGCLKLQDTDGAGYTYLTVLDGVATFSSTACN